MALEEFEKEQLSDRQKNAIKMRSITNYTMGLFFIAVGFFFMFPIKYTVLYIRQYDSFTIKMFAILCWVYGLFRLYRGYQKKYYKD